MDKLLAFLREKFSSCPCFQKGGCLCPEVDETAVKRVRVPFFKICFRPFSLLLDNGRAFFLTALPYAALITLFALLCGFGYMCIYSSGGYCSDSAVMYVVYSLLKLFLVTLFALKWYQAGLQGEPLTLRKLFSVDRRCFKLLGLFLLMVFINFLPMISTMILYVRVPNPDWRIEILFFALVSVGYVIPFLAVRFYAVIAFVLCGCKVPPLKEIWLKNSGNLMNLLAGLFLIFILLFFIFGSLYRNFQPVALSSGLYLNVVSEFIYNLVFLLGMALFVGHCLVERQILYPEDDAEEKDGKQD